MYDQCILIFQHMTQFVLVNLVTCLIGCQPMYDQWILIYETHDSILWSEFSELPDLQNVLISWGSAINK